MSSNKVCCHVILSNAGELEAFKRREAQWIIGTPRIHLGKLVGNNQQIWMEELMLDCLHQLKEERSVKKAYTWAKSIVLTCCQLAENYGNFMINQEMFFRSHQGETFVWISPNVLENKVKIYLPKTSEGSRMMVRSLVSSFKLWLKADFGELVNTESLEELLIQLNLQQSARQKGKQQREPDKRMSYEMNRTAKGSFTGKISMGSQNRKNLQQNQIGGNLDNKSEKYLQQTGGSGSESTKMINTSLSNKCPSNNSIEALNSSRQLIHGQFSPPQAMKLGRSGELSELKVQSDYKGKESKKFANLASQKLVVVNKSGGLRQGANYFPNKTASSANKIVSFILSQESDPNCYPKNKIIVEEQTLRKQQEAIRRMKESLDGIGEELNELFTKNENEEEYDKGIEEEFENIIG